MSHRHVICLVVDGLRAAALGAYGNTTSPTPQLDAIASRALVVDWLWADSPHLQQFYRSVWHGAHAIRPAVTSGYSSMVEQLSHFGVRQCLLSDDPWLTSQARGLPFQETRLLQSGREQVATRLEETGLASFFSEAIEQLQQWRDQEVLEESSSLTWLHCRGMLGYWDAPPEFRAVLLDEEDPPPTESVLPPVALHAIEDPDVLLAHRVAYAAQVSVLDACVGALRQAIEEAFVDCETLINIVGSTGFALGEHGGIGTECTELYSERLHLPWILYRCNNTTPLPRLAALAQPADMGATLLDWLAGGERVVECDGISYLPQLTDCELPTQHERHLRQMAVATAGQEEQAIRTAAWMLRQRIGASAHCELFTKPDDRWEANNICELCPEIAEQLQQELTRWQRSSRRGDPLPLVPQELELIAPSR